MWNQVYSTPISISRSTHFSLTNSAGPLFSDGAGVGGMTSKGENALAGLLRGLPEAQGILCGSIVSGLRLRPRNWAGAYACWGTENREAALRFVVGGPGNPYGGNVEVKVVDPSANPYLAFSAMLMAGIDGILRGELDRIGHIEVRLPDAQIDGVLQCPAKLEHLADTGRFDGFGAIGQ